MAYQENGEQVSAMSTANCNRVKVRNGMKMVIDDRLDEANSTHNEKPFEDLLSYINFEYKNGFTVCLMMKAEIEIDNEIYKGSEGLYGIKDEGQLLFIIYREHESRHWKLFYDEFNLLCDEEKEFYMMIDSILQESEVEQV